MSNIYVLIGQTASGKTEIFKRLISNINDLEPIVTSTSRPARIEEVEGVDYFFESHEFMEEHQTEYVCLDRFIVEPHGLCYYGIDPILNDLDDEKENKIVILSPSGYRQLKEKYGDRVIGYYIMASEKVRRKRYLSRENFSYEAQSRLDRRIEADFVDFRDFEFEVENLIVNQTKEQLEDAVDIIMADIIIDDFLKGD